MTPEEKFNHFKKLIETRKQEIAQTQGMLSMVKKQLQDIGINSKKELEEALKDAKIKYEAARVDYENKMRDFESEYKDYLRG